MKKILSFLALALFCAGAFTFQSCNKCATCTYTYELAGETLHHTYPELCGSNGDINDYEDVCEAAAIAAGGTCSCIED